MMARTGQRAERHRRVWRPRSGYASLSHAAPGLVGANSDARQLAHPALARAHRQGRVALQCLNVIEAFADAVAQVGGRDIGTETDKRALVVRNILWRLRRSARNLLGLALYFAGVSPAAIARIYGR